MSDGTELQLTGPTAKPFLKTFAFAGVTFVIVAVSYLALNPRAMRDAAALFDTLDTLRDVLFGMLLAAAVVGLWARRSARPWSLLRVGVTTCIASLVLSFPAWRPKDDPVLVLQRLLLAEVRAGHAQASQGAPNVFDLLAERFPANVNATLHKIALDLLSVHSSAAPNSLLDQFARARKAGRRQDEAAIVLWAVLLGIEQFEGDKIRNAPIESLRAAIGAHSDMVVVMRDNEGSCRQFKFANPTFDRVTRERNYRMLTAIADGRDRRIERAEPNDNDYARFISFSKSRGVAVDDWSLLAPDHAPIPPIADPARLCKALISYFEALLKTEGELGDRLLADTAYGLVTGDLAGSQSAAQ